MEKKVLRILVVENELTSKRGGQELSLLDVCRGLAGRGHRIVLFYTRSGDLEVQYRAFCEEMVHVKGYSVDRSCLLKSGGSFGSDLWKGVRRKVDLIYANQYLDSLFAGMLAKIIRAPFICHLRLPPPDRICGQYRIGLSLAKAFIAVSQKTRSEWAERGFSPEAIDVVYNGIDVKKFFPANGERSSARNRLGLGVNTRVVAYAGRLHPVKGIEILLEAFRRVSLNGADCRLLVYGKAADLRNERNETRNYQSELLAKARQLGIEKKILWSDYCDNMPALFAASDVVVLPSLWSEPFGRVLIESMACGVPVAASRVGGIPEVLKDSFSTLMFDAGSAAQLAGLLSRIMDWREKDPSLGNQCREYVSKNFSLEKTVTGIEASLSNRLGQFRNG